jgi:hypothetical protein
MHPRNWCESLYEVTRNNIAWPSCHSMKWIASFPKRLTERSISLSKCSVRGRAQLDTHHGVSKPSVRKGPSGTHVEFMANTCQGCLPQRWAEFQKRLCQSFESSRAPVSIPTHTKIDDKGKFWVEVTWTLMTERG